MKKLLYMWLLLPISCIAMEEKKPIPEMEEEEDGVIEDSYNYKKALETAEKQNLEEAKRTFLPGLKPINAGLVAELDAILMGDMQRATEKYNDDKDKAEEKYSGEMKKRVLELIEAEHESEIDYIQRERKFIAETISYVDLINSSMHSIELMEMTPMAGDDGGYSYFFYGHNSFVIKKHPLFAFLFRLNDFPLLLMNNQKDLEKATLQNYFDLASLNKVQFSNNDYDAISMEPQNIQELKEKFPGRIFKKDFKLDDYVEDESSDEDDDPDYKSKPYLKLLKSLGTIKYALGTRDGEIKFLTQAQYDEVIKTILFAGKVLRQSEIGFGEWLDETNKRLGVASNLLASLRTQQDLERSQPMTDESISKRVVLSKKINFYTIAEEAYKSVAGFAREARKYLTKKGLIT